jgi:hypothetical protein
MELRDYPGELLEASVDDLKKFFGGKAYTLIANVLWQACRWRRKGLAVTYGTTERGFWYRPLLPILVRAGHTRVSVSNVPVRKIHERYDKGALYRVYQRVCSDMVGRYRVLTYADLGFSDHRPDMRGVGARRPEVVLLSEKVGLQPIVERLASRFGVSWLVSHGMTKLLDAERFAGELRERGAGALRVIAYVDYDPAGWDIADAFPAQLARFGQPTSAIDHLVVPSRFSARELELFSYPVKGGGARDGVNQRWMERTGGIHGQLRGLHSDHLLPYERVERAFVEATGLRSK